MGMDWCESTESPRRACAWLIAVPRRSLREGYAWAEDKEHCEEYGRMLNGDASKACASLSRIAAEPDWCGVSQVSQRAKKRGLPQMGTLGAGNHYAEIQARSPGREAPPVRGLSSLVRRRWWTKFSTPGRRTRWESTASARSAS